MSAYSSTHAWKRAWQKRLMAYLSPHTVTARRRCCVCAVELSGRAERCAPCGARARYRARVGGAAT
jgi:hypothetical protein